MQASVFSVFARYHEACEKEFEMRIAKAYILLFVALTMRPASAQSAGTAQGPNPARSPVILLSGYKLQVVKGIDTFGAVIWKERGAEIHFEQGAYIPDPIASEKVSHILWKQEQVIDGKKVQSMYTKSHQLVVSFPELHADFFATIHSRQELAEMLLMVVTYRTEQYPVDASLLAPAPKSTK